MSKFSELIDMASDQRDFTLSDVLLKAKVLASHLRSPKFRQWIDAEINGYSHNATLPDYRVLPAKLIGEYAGYFHSRATTPISITHLDEKRREKYSTHHVYNGVSYVEDMTGGEDSLIGMYLDGYAVSYLREHGTQISNMVLNRVFKQVSRHSCQQLLQSVRSRLLDFLLEIRDEHPELDTNDAAATKVNPNDVDAAFERRVYHNCTIVEKGDMRDSYQAGQAGAMGPNANAENMNFVQILREAIGEHSLGELAADLEKLRAAMLSESKTTDQDEAVAAVAQAEDAAKKGDAKGVFGFLRKAGRWAFEVATKIGTSVASKAIERSIVM